MDDIKLLEEIGLREISRKTYIEVAYLQMMIDKNFEKLNRANALGFANIIQREYGIDLSNWIKEFNEYSNNNTKNTTDEQVFDSQNPSSFQNKFYITVLVVFMILLIVFLYYLFYGKNEAPRAQEQEATSIASPIVMKAVENLTDASFNAYSELDTHNESVTNDTVLISETNATSEILTNQADDINTPTLVDEFALLKPNTKLWIGVIDLNTFNKEVYSQNENLKIDLSRNLIIITGHGHFKLENTNGNDKSFASQEPKYLHVSNHTVLPITKEEFKTLNRGNNW